jgi:hypothetical protein
MYKRITITLDHLVGYLFLSLFIGFILSLMFISQINQHISTH